MTIDLSPEAKARRREQFKEAAVSVRLSGLDPDSPAYDKVRDLHVEGVITTDQAVAMILADPLVGANPRPPLSEAQIASRREADSHAVWSLRMEDLKCPPESEPLHEAHIRGEITTDQLVAAFDAQYKKKT